MLECRVPKRPWERVRPRRHPARGRVLRAWLDGSVIAAFAYRILPVDEAVARRAAALHVPDPAPFRDALIAASALVHSMTMVTRNVRDFERFAGLAIVNPWEPNGSSPPPSRRR